MALNVAELVGSLEMDVDEFERALNSSGDEFQDLVRRIQRLSDQAEESAPVIEPTVDDTELREGLQDSERAVGNFGEKMAGVAATAGAAAAVAFGVALLGALDEQAVGAKVAAQLGYGSADAKRFGKIAGKLYSEGWGESVGEIGEAIRQIMAMKLVPEDAGDEEIADVARQAQILADVFDQDVKAAAESVQQMIRNGLVPDATAGFDLITRGIQEGVDKSDDLLDTFNEYSTQFRELGLSGPEALGLMNQALKAGARDADTAADALKEFAIRAKDGSKASAEGFKAIGLDAEKMTAIFSKGGPAAREALGTVIDKLKAMKDPVAQDAAAVALFGTKAEDMQDALFAMDPETATQGLDNLAGATDRAGDAASDNAAAKLESFKRTLQHTLVEMLGNKVLPILEKVVDWLSKNLGPALAATGRWLEKYEGWLKPIGVMLLAFVGPILAIVAAMKVWAAITAAYTVIQGALNAVLAANPIGLIVLAIAALVAGLIYAYHHSEAFRKIVDATWKGIATGALWLWHTILKPIFDLWWTYAQFVFDKLVGFFKWWWETASTYAGFIWDLVSGLFKAWVSYATWVFDKLTGFFSWWYSTARTYVGAIWSVISGLGNAIRDLWNRVGSWIGNAFSSAVGIARGAINGLFSLMNRAISFINNGFIRQLNRFPGVSVSYIPSLPHLAVGGVVHPSAGGTPVVMGDGGQVEYGVPHDTMAGLIADAVAAGRGSTAGPGGERIITLVIEGRGVMAGIRGRARIAGGESRGAQTVLVGR